MIRFQDVFAVLFLCSLVPDPTFATWSVLISPIAWTKDTVIGSPMKMGSQLRTFIETDGEVSEQEMMPEVQYVQEVIGGIPKTVNERSSGFMNYIFEIFRPRIIFENVSAPATPAPYINLDGKTGKEEPVVSNYYTKTTEQEVTPRVPDSEIAPEIATEIAPEIAPEEAPVVEPNHIEVTNVENQTSEILAPVQDDNSESKVSLPNENPPVSVPVPSTKDISSPSSSSSNLNWPLMTASLHKGNHFFDGKNLALRLPTQSGMPSAEQIGRVAFADLGQLRPFMDGKTAIVFTGLGSVAEDNPALKADKVRTQLFSVGSVIRDSNGAVISTNFGEPILNLTQISDELEYRSKPIESTRIVTPEDKLSPTTKNDEIVSVENTPREISQLVPEVSKEELNTFQTNQMPSAPKTLSGIPKGDSPIPDDATNSLPNKYMEEIVSVENIPPENSQLVPKLLKTELSPFQTNRISNPPQTLSVIPQEVSLTPGDATNSLPNEYIQEIISVENIPPENSELVPGHSNEELSSFKTNEISSPPETLSVIPQVDSLAPGDSTNTLPNETSVKVADSTYLPSVTEMPSKWVLLEPSSPAPPTPVMKRQGDTHPKHHIFEQQVLGLSSNLPEKVVSISDHLQTLEEEDTVRQELFSQGEVEEYLAYIRKEHDHSNCISLLICEITASPERYGQEGYKTAKFFKEHRFSRRNRLALWYKTVSRLGDNMKSLTMCRSTFRPCSFSTTQLKQLGQKMLFSAVAS